MFTACRCMRALNDIIDIGILRGDPLFLEKLCRVATSSFISTIVFF